MSGYVSPTDPEERLDLHWPLTIGAWRSSPLRESQFEPHVYLSQDRGEDDSRIESVRVTIRELPAMIAALQKKLPVVEALAGLNVKASSEDGFLESLHEVLCHAFDIASGVEPNGAGQLKDALDAAIKKVEARLGRGPIERIAEIA